MRFSEIVAIFGGADPEDPRDAESFVRHFGVGALLILVAIWALLGTSAAFHSIMKAPWLIAVGVGLLVAGIVFWLDILITCTPLKSDSGWHRLRMVIIRGLISLALSLVVAQSTIQYMYRDSLAQIVSAHNQAEAQARTQWIKSHSNWSAEIAADKQQILTDDHQIGAANGIIGNARGQLNSLRSSYHRDFDCVGNGLAADGEACGPGPTSSRLAQEVTDYQNSTLPAILNVQDGNIAVARSDISQLKSAIDSDTGKLNQQIQQGTSADLADTGLAAQSAALLTLLNKNKLAWLWPLFFLAIDLAVAMMKGVLPESEFDRRRRLEREQDDQINLMVKNSPEWRSVAEHKASRAAQVAKTKIDVRAEKAIAALTASVADVKPSRAGQERSVDHPENSVSSPARPAVFRRMRWPNLRLRWDGKLSVTISLLGLLAITIATPGSSSSSSSSRTLSAVNGQSITLDNGEKLEIPPGAITGNAEVTATYTSPHTWAGKIPVSAEVTFKTKGKIVGKPVLSLSVPPSLIQSAIDGLLHVAFRSSAPSGWTQAPAIYERATETMDAVLTHFSTWRFWATSEAAYLTAVRGPSDTPTSVASRSSARLSPPPMTLTGNSFSALPAQLPFRRRPQPSDSVLSEDAYVPCSPRELMSA